MSADVPVIAYFRGDDGYTMDAAVLALAKRLEAESGTPPDRWRTTGAETDAASIGMRVATAPLFGGGTVAVVVDPAPLLKSKADREALDGAIRTVAPGNALVFVEQGDTGARRSAALAGPGDDRAQGGRRREAVQGAARGPARGLDRGAREGARDPAGAGRREGARPPRRRVRPRGRRRPPAPGRARRRRAREARPVPALRPGDRGRRPRARRRGRARLDVGVPRRRRRPQGRRRRSRSSTACWSRRPSPSSSSSSTGGSAS